MELTINQVRNILYKLSGEGLVSFIRKKDKRKGWYIYFWTLDTEKCLVKLQEILKNKIEGLNEQLNSRNNKRYYICKSCDIEVGEEKALAEDFTCEECADVYELSNNQPHIKEIEALIQKKERDLKSVETELEEVREKKDKKRKRKIRKEEREKKAERKAKRKKRQVAKKKGKKKTKKKKKKKTGKMKKLLGKIKKKSKKKSKKKKPRTKKSKKKTTKKSKKTRKKKSSRKKK